MANLGIAPAGRSQIFPRIRFIKFFSVNILDVRSKVSRAPGNKIVMAQNDSGRAGKSYTGNVNARRGEFDNVPNARSGCRDVRIVCQERFSGSRALALYDPVVAFFAGLDL